MNFVVTGPTLFLSEFILSVFSFSPYPSLDLFHQSSNLLLVTAILSLSIRPSMSGKPSAPSKSVVIPPKRVGRSPVHLKITCSIVSLSRLHMSHRVSTSWNLALYVFVLSTPVLASNSKELPTELSYSCSFFISCFCALYIVKADFPCILSSHNFLSVSFTPFSTDML
uniref:Putative secreted protein n=1 Tax=Ixodes ricinus TaxID=34613 RepID=A0A147BDE1_IXORI